MAYVTNETDVDDSVLCPSSGQPDLLLHCLIFKLSQLAPHLDAIFDCSKPPRKLDVQKLRALIKKINKELRLVSRALRAEKTTVSTSSPLLSMSDTGADSGVIPSYHAYMLLKCLVVYEVNRLNILSAGLILSATFLMESGEYLDNGRDWQSKLEFRKLNSSVEVEIDKLCAYTASSLGNQFATSAALSNLRDLPIKSLDGLLFIWPLYVASKTPHVTDWKRSWIKAALRDIGEKGRIPKAVALACDDNRRPKYQEALAGVAVVDLGFAATRNYLPAASQVTEAQGWRLSV
ncbi:MAG: hypothetical protein Q9227_007276 [Pyrenula ochraceoflavens]